MSVRIVFRIACTLSIILASTTAFSTADVPAIAKKRAPKLQVGKKYIVITDDGKVTSGTLTKTSKTSITLTPNGGKQIDIPISKIEAIREVPQKQRVGKPAVKVVPAVKPKKQSKAKVVRRPLFRGQSTVTYPVADKVDAKDPNERLLVLTPQGPIIVELAVYLDGKPYRTASESLIDSQLKDSDTNKDGKTTWQEALANPRFIIQSSSYLTTNPATIRGYIRRYDLNQDGIVDRYELRSLMANRNRGGAFSITPNYNMTRTPDIMPLLDTDKDGVLSANELAKAGDRLKSRDADNNDLLDFAEISAATGRRLSRGVRLPAQPRDIHLLGPTASLTTIFSALKSRYGDRRNFLPESIFRIAPGLAKTLDLNKNGRVESGEMIGLHLAKPHAKLIIRCGSKDDQGLGVKLVFANSALHTKPEKTGSERCTLSLASWKLITSVVPTVPQTGSRYAATANSYLSRFDIDKNGYLTEKELKKQPAATSYLLRYFKAWDADGDGKVFRKEIVTYYDRQSLPRRCRVLGFTNSSGPSLFSALDLSGDSRLSLREMRQAGQTLKAMDRDRNGRIDADELQSETRLSFRQDGFYNYPASRFRPPNGRSATGPRRGPKWFVHMDKNGDGDVTLREFLGTKSQFKKLDTNNDGFIEKAEAEAAAKQKSAG